MPSSVKRLSTREKEDLRSVFSAAYMSSLCAAMAVAAHRRTGWPIVALRSKSGALLHAGTDLPGQGLIDIRGIHSEDEFRGKHEGTLSWAEEWQLMDEAGVTENDVDKASILLGLLFDDLPGSDPRIAKFAGFAEALEALCREHGVWLRNDSTHSIIAYEAYGEEVGFEVSFGPTGEARIERLLETALAPLRRFP